MCLRRSVASWFSSVCSNLTHKLWSDHRPPSGDCRQWYHISRIIYWLLNLEHPSNMLVHADFYHADFMTHTHTHTPCSVECYNTSDLGQSYTGRRATTQHGKPCQSWSEPHILFNANQYQELVGAENFCRNPGRLRAKPWCFTSRASWDYCNLPTNCTGKLSIFVMKSTLVPITIATGITTYIIEGTGDDRGSLGC